MADIDAQLADARTVAAKHKRSYDVWTVCKKQRVSELPATQVSLERLKTEQQDLKREHERLISEVAELKDRAERTKDMMRDVDHLKYIFKELHAALGEMAHTQSGMQSDVQVNCAK